MWFVSLLPAIDVYLLRLLGTFYSNSRFGGGECEVIDTNFEKASQVKRLIIKTFPYYEYGKKQCFYSYFLMHYHNGREERLAIQPLFQDLFFQVLI